MGSKRALARRLAALEGFEEPRLDLEQYPTPPGIAAELVHLADLRGDLDRPAVIDLGAGTGVLALGAALRGARAVGVERDPAALATARGNARAVDADAEWVLGDATRAPLCPDGATVLMNPPFGARDDNVHADRAFLETAAEVAAVSYSIHNAESRSFVEAFVADWGGSVTDAFRATLELERQFPFQESDRATIDAEVFRIEWDHSPR